MSAGNPLGPPGAPPSGGGGGGDFNVNPDPNDLSAIANMLKSGMVDIVKTVREAREVMKELPELAEQTGKKFQRAATDMKGIVLLSDNARDAFKEMAKYTTSLTKTLAAGKSLKDVRATLEAIVSSGQEAMQSGLLSTKQAQIMKRNIDGANMKLRELAHTTQDAFSDQGHADIIKFLKQYQREIDRATQSTARMGKITEGVASTRKNLIEAGLMKSGRFEKYAQFAEASVKLKEAAQAKREQKQTEFAAKRSEAQTKLLAIPGIALGLPKTKEGGIDWARAAANRKSLGKQIAPVAGGDVGDTMAALATAGGGPKSGILGKLTGGGMVEGAAGSVAGLVGKAAIPLAIAEAVKDLVVSIIDKNAEMNKQAETLAGGGILTGTGVSGADALLAARQNLTPSGFLGMNRLGLGYERNVKMAQAIMESGYNVEELGRGGVMGENLPDEFGPGTFGQVQKIAATSGRVAGLGDAESIQLTMKLLMQYHQSMEGTQDFFTNLNKDTRAAGLSTVKYISILGEITDTFDRLNKSVDQTSGVLRALSRTGLMTAEDLQENLKMILGDPKRDVGMQIYLDMQQRSSGQAGVNAKTQAQLFGKEADKAFETLTGQGGLGMSKEDVGDLRKLLRTPAGRDQINAMLTTYQAEHPDVDVKKLQVARGALETAGIEAQRQQLMEDFAGGKISAVDYQAKQAGLGKSAQVQANENLAAAKQVMRLAGISPDKLYGEGAIATTQKAQQLLQTFSLSPTLLRDTQLALQNQGQGRLQSALDSEDNAKKVYDKIVPKLGPGADISQMKTATGGQVTSYREALERWTKDKRYGGKFLSYLRGADEGINDLYNTNSDLSEGMDKQTALQQKGIDEEKARSVGMVTQNTAEIFANAFASFFNQIISILEKMRTWMAHSRFFGGISAEAEQQAGTAYLDPATQKLIGLAAKSNDDMIKQLRDQALVHPDDPKVKAALEQAENRQKELQQKFGKDSGLGVDDFNKEMADIKDILMDVNKPIQDLMGGMGVKVDIGDKSGPFAGQGEYTLSDQQMKDNADQIARWQQLGMVKVAPTKDTATGQTVYHIQTVHNYSAEWSQLSSQQEDTTKAMESVGQVSPESHVVK